MAATVGVLQIGLHLENTMSLKDKRRVVRSLTDRLRQKFNVAVAETDDLDDLRYATLTAVVVSNSAPHCDQMMATLITFVERNVEMGVLNEISTELIPV